MKKYKIFFGNQSTVTAAAKLNEWLEKNPNIIIHTWQYQQARFGDHSICIEMETIEDCIEMETIEDIVTDMKKL